MTHTANGHVARNQRRIEAITRTAHRDLRTPEQQIALLDERGQDAVRERARLTGRVAK